MPQITKYFCMSCNHLPDNPIPNKCQDQCEKLNHKTVFTVCMVVNNVQPGIDEHWHHVTEKAVKRTYKEAFGCSYNYLDDKKIK